MSRIMAPSTPVLCVRRAAAKGFGWYPSRCAVSRTRVFVAWLILILPSRRLSTLETVPTETCAASAISAIVTEDRQSIQKTSSIELINADRLQELLYQVSQWSEKDSK